jgi:hypothetical protein
MLILFIGLIIATLLIERMFDDKKEEGDLFKIIFFSLIKILVKLFICLSPLLLLQFFLEKNGAIIFKDSSENQAMQNYLAIVLLILTGPFWFNFFNSDELDGKLNNLSKKQRIDRILDSHSHKIILPAILTFVALRTIPFIYSWLVVHKFL